MAASLFHRLNAALQRFEYAISVLLRGRFPPDAFCVLGVVPNLQTYDDQPKAPFSLKELIGDGLLWAVPRSRRTIEKRHKRKYGTPGLSLKLLLPKRNLRECNTCGHNHEIGILCPNCYEKVRLETKAMQDSIQENLGLDPVDQDVIVLYEGERTEQAEEFWQGKRIIELKKPRPAWFSKNLLQQTTQQPAITTDVKPTELA